MISSKLKTALRNPARRALLALALPLLAGTAMAQAWPAKPITIVVPFPPGGPTDIATRIVAQKMALALKQPVLIDNRSGASGTVGAGIAARAAPDGYTFVMLATPTLLAAHLYGPTSYDIFKSFTPVGTVYDLPIVMVVNPKALPEVTGLQQLITKAKADGGKFNYTTAGASRPPQEVASKPGKPCSATVFTSGSSRTRAPEPTAIGSSVPARMCGITATRSENIAGTWPPIRSVTAGALPRYGTCCISNLPMFLSCSVVR